ncbi:MAG: hypothetical protein RLZZ111_312 [Planctomycetota bacterium]
MAAAMPDRTGRFMIQWWTSEDGLPDTGFTGVAIGPDGRVYCCSRERLVRFDGRSFETVPERFTKPLREAIGSFWSLGFDGAGRLWVQGGQAAARLREGESLLRPAAWTVHALPTGKIFSMTFGPDGHPVFVGPDMLATFDGERIVQAWAGAGDDEPIRWRYGGVSPANGEIWLWGSKPNPRQLLRSWQFSGGKVAAVEADGSSIGPEIISLGFGPSGTWALLPDAIAINGPDGWERRLPQLPDPAFRISGKIVESSDRTVWVSDHSGLLACRDGRIETVIEGIPGFSSFTTHLVADAADGIWAACAGGLLAIRPAAVRVRPVDECRTVFVRRDGSMLVGVPGAVVEIPAEAAAAEMDAAREPPRPVATLPTNAVPTALVETADGRIWVGTQGSYILRIEDGTVRQLTKPDKHFLELRTTHALAVDTGGRVWAGTANGLAMHDPQTDEFRLVANYELPLQSFVIGLESEADGGILVATVARGVERVNPDGEVTSVLAAADLPSRKGVVFHRDSRGTLWIGGDRGLLGITARGAKFSHTTATGLVDDAVRQIEEDAQGRLWVATRDGHIQGMRLDSLDRLRTGKAQVVRGVVLGPLDGLGDSECVGGISDASAAPAEPPAWRADERIVVPLAHGIATFDPAWLPGRARVTGPPVIEPTAGGDGSRHGFTVSSPGVQWGDAPLYQTFVRGVDTAWSSPASATRRDYAVLPSGEQRFEARLVAGEEDRDFPSAKLDLEVPTPLWLRPAVWAFAAAIGSLGTFFVAREVTRRRARREVEQLERQREMDRERARIARDIHDSLGAGLTQVALMSDLARRGGLPADEIRDRFETIYGRARRLARSVDEIVWAVNPKNDTVGQFIPFVVNDVEDFARAGDLTLRLHLPDGPCAAIPLSTQVRHHLCLAIREVLQNVLRHARATQIDFTIDVLPESLAVAIRDDGVGFEAGRPLGPDQDGLANIRARLAELGGRAAIDSVPGAGTCVRLTVPLGGEPTRTAAGSAHELAQEPSA